MRRTLGIIVTLTAFFLNWVSTEAQSGKGVAGRLSEAQMQEMGAGWYHHWSPCGPKDNRFCVDCLKGRWTLEMGMPFYGDLEAVKERLALCESGWFMFGDEWQMQNDTGQMSWPMEKQVAELAWFLALRDEVNPDCKVAFGGILAWHPSMSMTGAEWVHVFAESYQIEHGALPDVQALVIDTYHFPAWGRDWESDTVAMIEAIREVYGVEIWAREMGNLTYRADEAMELVPSITRHFDRYAWFIGEGESWWNFTALYIDSEITSLGRMYKTLPAMHRVFVPIFGVWQ